MQVKLNFFNNSDNSKIQKDYTFICIEGENTFYHPDFDIAVIDISKFIKEEEKKDNIQLHYKAFRTHNIGAHIYPTQVLFMTGYPRGLYDKTHNLPITRAGTASSSSKLDYNGNKEFLADIPCFGGSSGSPVFMISSETGGTMENVYYIPYSKINLLGLLKGGPLFPIKNKQGSFRIPMGLGRVIKAEKIKEFVENLRQGDYQELDLSKIPSQDEDMDYCLDDIDEDVEIEKN